MKRQARFRNLVLLLHRIYKNLLFYLRDLYHRIDDHHIFLMGGGLAFSLFVCIVPLVLILFSIVGNLLETDAIEHQVIAFVDQIIPYPDYADFVKGILASRIDEVVAYKGIAGFIGIPGLLFAASGLFSSMRTILNTIYDVSLEEPVILGKLKDLGMVVLVVIFILSSTTVLPILEVLKDSAHEVRLLKFIELSLIQELFFSISSFLFIFLLFLAMYYVIPYQKMELRVALISALWATIFWEVARQAFGFYITHFATLGKIYGAYILLVVVAFWIYYSSLVFILGAEIGHIFKTRQGKH